MKILKMLFVFALLMPWALRAEETTDQSSTRTEVIGVTADQAEETTAQRDSQLDKLNTVYSMLAIHNVLGLDTDTLDVAEKAFMKDVGSHDNKKEAYETICETGTFKLYTIVATLMEISGFQVMDLPEAVKNYVKVVLTDVLNNSTISLENRVKSMALLVFTGVYYDMKPRFLDDTERLDKNVKYVYGVFSEAITSTTTVENMDDRLVSINNTIYDNLSSNREKHDSYREKKINEDGLVQWVDMDESRIESARRGFPQFLDDSYGQLVDQVSGCF